MESDVIICKIEKYDAVLDVVERVLGILPCGMDEEDVGSVVFIAVEDDIFDSYFCGATVNLDDIDGVIVDGLEDLT